MAISIYDAYDKSIELLRAGELPEAAIYHALQHEIDYGHDAQRMLAHWHQFRVRPFSLKGGYPRASSASPTGTLPDDAEAK